MYATATGVAINCECLGFVLMNSGVSLLISRPRCALRLEQV